jgi:starch synthase (maltosyl-transferring)
MELSEGAELVDKAMRRVKGKRRATLKRYASDLRDVQQSLEQRVGAALSEELATAMRTYVDQDTLTRCDRVLPLVVDRERARFGAWYEMFPRSQGTEPGRHGTFRDAEQRLPEVAERGFDIIYLPPIHPIGHTNRKGRGNALQAEPGDPGSPWAIGSEEGGFTAVEPQLGTIEDFEHFVEATRSHGMEVALDYALQCSPDHPWVTEHPEWFFFGVDGTIKYAENPPKKYEDIYPLNFWSESYAELWEACRDIFLFWIDRGVKVFRVDNPHTKPYAFWEWVLGEVRRDHPDVIFLSEAFTRPARMKGLAKLGFTQSYTYFTWRNSALELRDYLTELTTTDMREYFRPNFFANTPDILHEYLQHGGRPAFRVRLLLAATLSPSYGIYSGFELCENTPQRLGSEEYLHSEKYEIRVRDWNAPGNINPDIERINRIRRDNPALRLLDNLSFEVSENPDVLFYRKSAPDNELFIAVNLHPHEIRETMVHIPVHRLGLGASEPYVVEELLSGDRYTWQGSRNYVRLDPQREPGHVLRLVRA